MMAKRKRVVTLMLDGKEYKVVAGDTFVANLSVHMDVDPRSENKVDISGVITAAIKIVSVD